MSLSLLDFAKATYNTTIHSDVNKRIEMNVHFDKDNATIELEVYSGAVGDKSKRNTEYSGTSMEKALEVYNSLGMIQNQ